MTESIVKWPDRKLSKQYIRTRPSTFNQLSIQLQIKINQWRPCHFLKRTYWSFSNFCFVVDCYYSKTNHYIDLYVQKKNKELHKKTTHKSKSWNSCTINTMFYYCYYTLWIEHFQTLPQFVNVVRYFGLKKNNNKKILISTENDASANISRTKIVFITQKKKYSSHV